MTVLPNVPIPAGALLYQRAVTNQIGVTAQTSSNIGYLTTNLNRLEVVTEITAQDPTDMYNFTFQNSGPATLTVNVLTGKNLPRITLMDQTGTRIIADSGGTADQQAAYKKFISPTGLDLTQGKYVIKATYTPGTPKDTTDFTLQIQAGSTFKNDYRTLASPTTLRQTLLAGGSLGYNSLSATASLLASASQGVSLSSNIFGTLSLFATNQFNILA